MFSEDGLCALWQSIKVTEGMELSAPGIKRSLDLINRSKECAKGHQWLYHCTDTIALRSIIQNNEFWISNLKWVNDKEESAQIDVPQYETSFYVACFTYENDVSP